MYKDIYNLFTKIISDLGANNKSFTIIIRGGSCPLMAPQSEQMC